MQRRHISQMCVVPLLCPRRSLFSSTLGNSSHECTIAVQQHKSCSQISLNAIVFAHSHSSSVPIQFSTYIYIRIRPISLVEKKIKKSSSSIFIVCYEQNDDIKIFLLSTGGHEIEAGLAHGGEHHCLQDIAQQGGAEEQIAEERQDEPAKPLQEREHRRGSFQGVRERVGGPE